MDAHIAGLVVYGAAMFGLGSLFVIRFGKRG